MTEAHYYPFGLVLNGKWLTGGAEETKYRYNGKEIDEEFGLDWYAYGARYYDPTLARFTGVDPISDQFPWVSTFNYAENKPINSIDLHGLQSWEINLSARLGEVKIPKKRAENDWLGPAIGYTFIGLGTITTGGVSGLIGRSYLTRFTVNAGTQATMNSIFNGGLNGSSLGEVDLFDAAIMSLPSNGTMGLFTKIILPSIIDGKASGKIAITGAADLKISSESIASKNLIQTGIDLGFNSLAFGASNLLNKVKIKNNNTIRRVDDFFEKSKDKVNPDAWAAANLQGKRAISNTKLSADVFGSMKRSAIQGNAQIDVIKQYILGIANPSSKATAKQLNSSKNEN